MFSNYRSQKNIQHKQVDYKSLYLEQKRLKQQFQRKAQISELRYRKLAQSINKKCIRCKDIDYNKTKQDDILQLKNFHNGLKVLDLTSAGQFHKKTRVKKDRIIENFGVFGIPQSMLMESQVFDEIIQGELLYVSNIPSLVEEHAAKLSFPSGIVPQYFSGLQAKQKAIQIMSSSCSLAKTFIMGFQSKSVQLQLQKCELKRLMNPQNKLYAICLTIDDFSLVPYWQNDLIESQKVVNMDHNKIASAKALSCEETALSCRNESSIATAPRVYCVFSYYPFFEFYQQILKSIINSVKTQRLVIYRESGCALAEADSHFFLQRVKDTYRELYNQIEKWEVKLTKQFELKLMNCQKISLSINPQLCMMNFVHEWGLSIFSIFNVETFLDVFTMMMLEQKMVFVCQNPTVLTFAVHLFTQLLPRPFKYPYPVIYLLPENEGYFQTICPFVYGLLNSKKNITLDKTVQRFSNVFIILQKQGAEILSRDAKKSLLKKKSKILHEKLLNKFKLGNQKNRRVSNLTFAEQSINFQRDKQGLCSQIIKIINLYLNEEVMKNLPRQYEILEIKAECEKTLRPNQDLNQLAFQKIKKKYIDKSKQEFFRAFLETQIVNTFLFK